MFDLSNFISPKELMKMKEEVVEETLSLAYPIVALQYDDGIVLLGQNPSSSLHKTSELYDRIAFAGTGVFNDYERLRRAGVHMADVRGFQYSRADVKAKFIASEYSTVLGDIFSRQQVPMEVEILVTEIGQTQEEDRMYYIPFSGGLIEERKFAVIGDFAREDKEIRKGLMRKYLREKDPATTMSLKDAVRLGRDVIAAVRLKADLQAGSMELVSLDRGIAGERKFKRFDKNEIEQLLNGD